MSRRSRPSRAAGFTLVELLVVIIIIGMLAALLLTAIGRAKVTAVDARMTAEINDLDLAMKAHKEKYDAFPVDSNQTMAQSQRWQIHLRRMFPRCTTNMPTVGAIQGVGINGLDEAEALVYWLGGVSDRTIVALGGSASTKTTGWSLNPLNPFDTGTQRSAPLFQFDQSRLMDRDNDNLYEYYPPHKKNLNDGVMPYVYFQFTNYASGPTYQQSLSPGAFDTTHGTAVPWRRNSSTEGALTATSPFINPESFQILSAGQDNDFGENAVKGFPSLVRIMPPIPLNRENFDNLANFTTGRLEERK